MKKINESEYEIEYTDILEYLKDEDQDFEINVSGNS